MGPQVLQAFLNTVDRLSTLGDEAGRSAALTAKERYTVEASIRRAAAMLQAKAVDMAQGKIMRLDLNIRNQEDAPKWKDLPPEARAAFEHAMDLAMQSGVDVAGLVGAQDMGEAQRE